MSADTMLPRSRRAILAGALGGAVAVVADAMGRPRPARAGTDGDVVLGAVNTSVTTTDIHGPAEGVTLACSTTGGIAISTSSGTGVGVSGMSTTLDGVRGLCVQGTGVYGYQGSMMGVPDPSPETGIFGITAGSPASIGVLGRASTGTGVHGFSHDGSGVVGATDSATHGATEGRGSIGVAGFGGTSGGVPTSAAGTGVYGFGTAMGVYGDSANGVAVVGASQAGGGVLGTTTVANYGAVDGRGPVGVAGWGGVEAVLLTARAGTGVYGKGSVAGVRGEATSGVGVYATATTGAALQVVGKAKFDRAGTVTMRADTSSYRRTVAGVTTASQAFAVLRTRRSGVTVAAVTCGTGYLTIYLTKTLTYATAVSYFVVN